MGAGLLWEREAPNSGQRRGPRGRTEGCSISPPAADPPDSEAQGSAAAETSVRDRALGATPDPLEHIDHLFHHTSRRIWLGILGTAILIAAGVIWTVVAKQVQTVQADAVIVPRAGLFTVETAQVGQVSTLPVRVGSDVSEGQPRVTLARPGAGRTSTVPSPVPGVVVSVDVRARDIVQAGVPLFLIAPRGAPPMAIGLYPAAKIDQISVGLEAEVAVNGVDPSKYGFALGRVVAIGPIPVTNLRLSQLTGNSSLQSLVAQLGPLREVDIKLERAATPSGLKWSVGTGPSTRLPIGVLAAAKITVGKQTILHQAFG